MEEWRGTADMIGQKVTDKTADYERANIPTHAQATHVVIVT